MSSQKPNIGFVGLGAMGFGMATNLVKEGYHVKGFDVFQASVDRFVQAGGIGATSLADSATDSPFYVCMVATAAQAESVLFEKELVTALPKGATLLLCSTVPSSYAISVEKKLTAIGRGDVHFIDCPVSGGAARAANGTLSIMAGGSDAAIEKGRFLLSAMSDPKKLYIVKGGAGGGSNLKMVHQVLAAIQILMTSEAMGLAAKMGLNAKEVQEAVIASDGWSWMFENRLPRLLAEDYFPGVSALTIILKDVGIITTTAREQGFPTPLCSTAEQIYIAGLPLGFGPNDDAGMVRMYCQKPIAAVSSAPSDSSAIKLIVNLLACVHACAAAEALSFTKYLGLDLTQMSELVNDAAGGSRSFQKEGPAMIALLEGKPEVGGGVAIDEVLKTLNEVVVVGKKVECPLYLTNEALNLVLMAKRKGLGKLGVANLVKVWDGGL